MTTHLVTFASPDYSESAALCQSSAKAHGIDSASCVVPAYSSSERGFGFWKWKPEIIDAILNGADPFCQLRDRDTLLYADAGIEFLNNVNYIIDRMDQDIFLFGNNWEHAHWCKRDIIEAIMNGRPWLWEADGSCYYCGSPTSTDYDGKHTWCTSSNGGAEGCGHVPQPLAFGKQAQASVIFFRVSDYTRKFVREWLDWCLFEGGRLIDDSSSRTPNHPEFRENRHDQAILTTMAYRDGLRLHYWPASYNDGAFTYEKLSDYAGDDYPVLFNHHRRRNEDWKRVA